MKKSFVALSMIAVLGATWTGSAWYTGKKIEQNMTNILTKTNAILANNGLTLSYENYQRGIFSSRAQYILRDDGHHASILDGKGDIVLNEVIEHGPFPVTQLKKFHLIPSLASVHSELARTSSVEALFQITKGKSPFNADSRISYNGDNVTTFNLIPFDLQQNDIKVASSGLHVHVIADHDMRTLSVEGNTDNINIGSKDDNGQMINLTFQGLSLKNHSQKNEFNIGLGDNNVTIKKLQISRDGKDDVAIDNLVIDNRVNEKASKINMQGNYSLTAFKIMGVDLGSSNISLNIDNLDAKAVQEFTSRYNEQREALFLEKDLSADEFRQKKSDIFLQNVPLLLKGNPTFHLSPVSWQNSQGKSTFTLDLDLQGPTEGEALTTFNGQQPSQVIKNANASLSIPLNMATETATQIAKINGGSDSDAKNLAQNQIRSLIMLGTLSNLFEVKDNTLISQFHYADNKIVMNGKSYSLQDLLNNLPNQ